jgi:hypothetical protein
VERFFGSLKHDWIFKVAQPTHEHMMQDVTTYMRYYNQERLYSSNDDMSPVRFEISQVKVSCLGWPEHGMQHLGQNSWVSASQETKTSKFFVSLSS